MTEKSVILPVPLATPEDIQATVKVSSFPYMDYLHHCKNGWALVDHQLSI